MKRGYFFLLIFLLITACNKETPEKLQKRLVGDWMGTTLYSNALVKFSFEEDGHFTSEVISGPITSVFFFLGVMMP